MTEAPSTSTEGEFPIFVQRFMHFMNLFTVYRDLLSGHYVPKLNPSPEMDAFPLPGETIMFLLYALFYSLIESDKNGVNAFRLWRKHFPEEESAIATVEAQVTPFAESLRVFRNRLGFHGSPSWSHEAPGFELFAKHSGVEIWNAMAKFKSLSAALLTKDLERRNGRNLLGK